METQRWIRAEFLARYWKLAGWLRGAQFPTLRAAGEKKFQPASRLTCHDTPPRSVHHTSRSAGNKNMYWNGSFVLILLRARRAYGTGTTARPHRNGTDRNETERNGTERKLGLGRGSGRRRRRRSDFFLSFFPMMESGAGWGCSFLPHIGNWLAGARGPISNTPLLTVSPAFSQTHACMCSRRSLKLVAKLVHPYDITDALLTDIKR